MKPNLFIMGAQKSGSTFLTFSLNQHPDISIVSLEDKTFEDPEYELYNGDFSHLDRIVSKKMYGLSRPNYFGEKKYQIRIKEHFPDSKIIISLRDPTKRAVSAYYHYMKYGIIPAKSPNFLIELFSKEFDNPKYGGYSDIKGYGLYHSLLQNIYQLFDKKNVKIVKFDDLISSNSSRIFENIFKFLDLENIELSKPQIKLQKSQYNYKRYLFNNIYFHKKYEYDSKFKKMYSLPYKEMSRYNQIYFNIFTKISSVLFENSKDDIISKEILRYINRFYLEDIKKLKTIVDFDIDEWIENYRDI